MIDEKANARKYKAALVNLASEVALFQNRLDAEMAKPSSPERGSRIAKIQNELTMANHRALHFALGYSFKKIESLYAHFKAQNCTHD